EIASGPAHGARSRPLGSTEPTVASEVRSTGVSSVVATDVSRFEGNGGSGWRTCQCKPSSHSYRRRFRSPPGRQIARNRYHSPQHVGRRRVDATRKNGYKYRRFRRFHLRNTVPAGVYTGITQLRHNEDRNADEDIYNFGRL